MVDVATWQSSQRWDGGVRTNGVAAGFDQVLCCSSVALAFVLRDGGLRAGSMAVAFEQETWQHKIVSFFILVLIHRL